MDGSGTLVCSLLLTKWELLFHPGVFVPAMHDIVTPTLEKNGLLAALHPHDRELFATAVRIVRIAGGSVLYEPGDQVTAAFFPLGEAVASFMVVLEDGSSVETAMVGREGAIGGIVSTGHLASYSRACVMHGGYFARIDSNALEDLKIRAPGIRDLLSRYADCLLAQIFQSVACNAVHGLDQRAAKWLIVAVDRTGSNRVAMTQEHFGALLGIARSYASRLIQRFKRDGLLETRRGALIVTDPDGLRHRACGCEQLVRNHFEHVLRGVYPPPVTSDEPLKFEA